MDYKKLIALNVATVLLIVFSAMLFIASNEHNEQLHIQKDNIEHIKTLTFENCLESELKQQLLKVISKMYGVQNSVYELFYFIAKILLLLAVINLSFSIMVYRKCKI